MYRYQWRIDEMAGAVVGAKERGYGRLPVFNTGGEHPIKKLDMKYNWGEGGTQIKHLAPGIHESVHDTDHY